MKKAIKILYWIMASVFFLLFWYRERKVSELNHIDVAE